MRKLWALTIRLMLVTAMAVLLFDAVAVGLHYQAYAILILLGITYRMTRRRWQLSGTYGTAREAGPGDLLHGGYLGDRGLILGRIGHAGRPTRTQALRGLLSPRMPSEWAVRQFSAAFLRSGRPDAFIRINDFVHLATFSPAGGGKSVSMLAPNLLSYEGNCVVIDPKGELYKLSHEHRNREFGHTIVRLDPGRVFGPGDRFNPLDCINPRRPDFIESCRDMANMLVVRTGKEAEPHWPTRPKTSYVPSSPISRALEGNPDARNLRGVRTQLASRDNYYAALEVMQQQKGFYGVLEELGHSLTWHVDRELGSVMSHAQRFTNIFGRPWSPNAPAPPASTRWRLRNGRMTIYLISLPTRWWSGRACNGSGRAACCGSSRGACRPRRTRFSSSSMNVPISARCRH